MGRRFVGVDLGLRTFDVAVRPDGLHWVVPPTPEGVDDFATRMRELHPKLVVMEACGSLERSLARALEKAGISVVVMNPRQVRHDARSTGRLAKTDKLDAEMLARFAEFVQPSPRPLPDEDAERWRDSLARRHQGVTMMAAERNRRRQATASLRPGIDAHWQWLSGTLESSGR